MRAFFDLLEKCSVISVTERNEKFYTVKMCDSADMSAVLHNPEYGEILNMAEECELFQKSVLEDDISDIDNSLSVIL